MAAKITSLAILAFSLSLANAGILDDIKGEFIDRLCVTNHLSEFNQCFDQMKETVKNLDFNSLKDKAEKTDLEEACCSYLGYRDCIEQVAKKHCGEYVKNTVESFTNHIKGATVQCEQYNSPYQCWDLVALAGFAAIVLIACIVLVACVCVICKRCC